jgi:hypothetical protein
MTFEQGPRPVIVVDGSIHRVIGEVSAKVDWTAKSKDIYIVSDILSRSRLTIVAIWSRTTLEKHGASESRGIVGYTQTKSLFPLIKAWIGLTVEAKCTAIESGEV